MHDGDRVQTFTSCSEFEQKKKRKSHKKFHNPLTTTAEVYWRQLVAANPGNQVLVHMSSDEIFWFFEVRTDSRSLVCYCGHCAMNCQRKSNMLRHLNTHDGTEWRQFIERKCHRCMVTRKYRPCGWAKHEIACAKRHDEQPQVDRNRHLPRENKGICTSSCSLRTSWIHMDLYGSIFSYGSR